MAKRRKILIGEAVAVQHDDRHPLSHLANQIPNGRSEKFQFFLPYVDVASASKLGYRTLLTQLCFDAPCAIIGLMTSPVPDLLVQKNSKGPRLRPNDLQFFGNLSNQQDRKILAASGSILVHLPYLGEHQTIKVPAVVLRDATVNFAVLPMAAMGNHSQLYRHDRKKVYLYGSMSRSNRAVRLGENLDFNLVRHLKEWTEDPAVFPDGEMHCLDLPSPYQHNLLQSVS